MKFCEECGAQLEDDAVFCEECGTQVEELEIVPPIQPQNVEVVPPIQPHNVLEEKEKKAFPKKIIIIGVAILLTLIIGGVIAGVIIKNSNSTKDDDTKLVDATTDSTEKEAPTTEEATTEEATTEDVITEEATTEEATTEEMKPVPTEKIEVFKTHAISTSAGWYYCGEYEGGLVVDIADTSMVFMRSFRNIYNSYSFTLSGYDPIEYGVEYNFTDMVYDNGIDFETYELIMTIYEDGIDIYWVVKEGSSLVEVYNGFYEMIDVQASCSNTLTKDVLNYEKINNIYNFESDCFYKNLFGGALRSINYYVTEYSSDIQLTVGKDYVEDLQYISVGYGEGSSTFPINEELYYNQEAVFYYEYSSLDDSYVELDYSINKNGQKVYDLSEKDYYEEVRITFTEEYIEFYWSSHSFGDESIVYEEQISEDSLIKEIYISNYY